MDLKNGNDRVINGLEFHMKEHTFIFRGSYPPSYLKFIKKEDWYLAMKKEVKQYFVKEKGLDSKEERRRSLWANVYTFAKDLIERRLPEYFPQTAMNGHRNLWIVKPGGLSRGRQIKIFDNYADICKYALNGMQIFENQAPPGNEKNLHERISWTKKTWVVQKYIENPLLIFCRKFDIRVWVVVASWNPLKVYWYRKPYVRFSGQDYDAKKIDNLYIHLTNNSITSKQVRLPNDK